MTHPPIPPIAIVSIGALFPGAPTTAAFWRDLVDGRDRISEVPRTHWLAADYFDPTPGTPDKVYTTRGGFLPAVELSPLELGLPPTSLPAIDTAQLLALIVAKRVLTEATRGRYEAMDRSRIAVLLGVASATELVAHMSGRNQIPVVPGDCSSAAAWTSIWASTQFGITSPRPKVSMTSLSASSMATTLATSLETGFVPSTTSPTA